MPDEVITSTLLNSPSVSSVISVANKNLLLFVASGRTTTCGTSGTNVAAARFVGMLAHGYMGLCPRLVATAAQLDRMAGQQAGTTPVPGLRGQSGTRRPPKTTGASLVAG